MEGTFKEKEAKIRKARPFTKLTFEMRLWQVATEKNVADEVFPYIKNQTMTMSEKELQETLASLNKELTLSQPKYVAVTCDFVRWCLKIGFTAMNPIMRELDNLFGMSNVYSYSHVFPHQCLVSIVDRFRPHRIVLDLPQESTSATYHACHWMEGMRQKEWTLLTTQMILYLGEMTNLKLLLIGQGDNQVILIRLPEKHETLGTIEEIAQTFIAQLSSISAEMGMELKKEETWSSTTLFEYAKSYHLQGIPVSSGLKKACKIASEINAGIPSLANRVSSIFSQGTAVSGSDSHPAAGYFLACVEGAIILQDEMPSLVRSQITALLLYPRHLGGFPVLNYSSFCYRGLMDPLTTAIHQLQHIPIPRVKEYLMKLLDLTPSNNRDYLLLIKDLYGLNISVPKQPENEMRNLLKEKLPSRIENETLTPLFSIDADKEETKLVQDLSQVTPLKFLLITHITITPFFFSYDCPSKSRMGPPFFPTLPFLFSLSLLYFYPFFPSQS